MKWLKRKLARWVDEGWRAEEDEIDDNAKVPSAPHHVRNGLGRGTRVNKLPSEQYNEECFKNPLNITLYNAMGGKIIKFYSYDHQVDKSHETTYIIPSEMDFEVELGKCIAMESLKHTR